MSAVLGALVVLALGAQASAATTAVTNTFAPNGWTFTSESGSGGEGWFDGGVPGPPTFVGEGGAHFTLAGSADGVVLTKALRTSTTAALAQTGLGQVPTMNYRTYRLSADPGNNLAVALQFEFDYDITADGPYGGRIVFEPYQQPGVAGTVHTHEYRSWYTGPSSLWWLTRTASGTSNSSGPCNQASPCTFAQIIALYPNAGLAEFHVGGTYVADVVNLKAGSSWPGFDGYVDQFTYGSEAWNFEGDLGPCSIAPTDTETKTIRLRDDCSTSHTLAIEDGYTLDGDAHSITAHDPGSDHFRGAIVTNGGDTANVTDVEITSYRLHDVCDGAGDRLRGVLFESASGSITDVDVHGVRQGLSGCQEGNAIEVRNFDATTGEPGATQLSITISHNTVADYQKNGITANGNVSAKITGNTVAGDGQIDYTAQNGIQVGFGASALIRGNTVSGNWYTPESFVACGLLFFEAAGVKQQANTLDDNERNLCNYGRGGGNVDAT
ncbi:MAG TPA: right-handed parallel beta-helix repeat-containing protein [Gaiella sp.]|nr:right-handed parallel beta-helix repeat-containing protein [Gaiella sp.]